MDFPPLFHALNDLLDCPLLVPLLFDFPLSSGAVDALRIGIGKSQFSVLEHDHWRIQIYLAQGVFDVERFVGESLGVIDLPL